MVAGFGLCALWGKHDDCEPGGLLSKGFRMLSFPSSMRIFLALQPCDMRKSFDGLYALVEHALEDTVRSGAVLPPCDCPSQVSPQSGSYKKQHSCVVKSGWGPTDSPKA